MDKSTAESQEHADYSAGYTQGWTEEHDREGLRNEPAPNTTGDFKRGYAAGRYSAIESRHNARHS